MQRVFIHPMLELIYNGYPRKNCYYSFQLLFFCPYQFFFIVKENCPFIHTHQFHTHTRYLCHFSRIFFKSAQFKMMAEKRMNSMAAFMHHRGYIIQRSCCIHKNKRGAAFSQWHIVTSGSFTLSALKIKMPELFHFS